jgi:hypothetical protein
MIDDEDPTPRFTWLDALIIALCGMAATAALFELVWP